MASLDNFHTGHGAQLRRTQYPSEQDRMKILGLGLHSSKNWDVSNLVPVSYHQHMANDYVGLQHVTPRYTERRDSHTLDLFVPTVPYVDRMRGSTSESTLLYDKKCCPFHKWFKGSVKLNANSKRIRSAPY